MGSLSESPNCNFCTHTNHPVGDVPPFSSTCSLPFCLSLCHPSSSRSIHRPWRDPRPCTLSFLDISVTICTMGQQGVSPALPTHLGLFSSWNQMIQMEHNPPPPPLVHLSPSQDLTRAWDLEAFQISGFSNYRCSTGKVPANIPKSKRAEKLTYLVLSFWDRGGLGRWDLCSQLSAIPLSMWENGLGSEKPRETPR